MKKSRNLQIAIQAAKIGAKIASSYYNTQFTVEIKKDKSVVSIADRKTEEAIKEYILKQDPHAKFLAEESGGDISEDSFWLIDPIDGSRPFVRGIPFWCVLISRYEKGEVTLGVCYFPLLTDGLLFAERGKGAYCGNKKLQVSKVKTLEDGYMTFGSIRHFKSIEPLMRIINKMNGVRGYDPTYSHYLLAQGKIEVTIDVYAFSWDSAPFKVIVEEAGGKITMPDGSPWSINGRGFIATNGILHKEIIGLYNKK